MNPCSGTSFLTTISVLAIPDKRKALFTKSMEYDLQSRIRLIRKAISARQSLEVRIERVREHHRQMRGKSDLSIRKTNTKSVNRSV